jgi:hypothetical protein
MMIKRYIQKIFAGVFSIIGCSFFMENANCTPGKGIYITGEIRLDSARNDSNASTIHIIEQMTHQGDVRRNTQNNAAFTKFFPFEHNISLLVYKIAHGNIFRDNDLVFTMQPTSQILLPSLLAYHQDGNSALDDARNPIGSSLNLAYNTFVDALCAEFAQSNNEVLLSFLVGYINDVTSMNDFIVNPINRGRPGWYQNVQANLMVTQNIRTILDYSINVRLCFLRALIALIEEGNMKATAPGTQAGFKYSGAEIKALARLLDNL